MNDEARRQLDEATQTRYAIGSLSLKVMEAVRNGRPLSLNEAERITIAWVLGAAESLAAERECQAREPILEANARQAARDIVSSEKLKKASKR